MVARLSSPGKEVVNWGRDSTEPEVPRYELRGQSRTKTAISPLEDRVAALMIHFTRPFTVVIIIQNVVVRDSSESNVPLNAPRLKQLSDNATYVPQLHLFFGPRCLCFGKSSGSFSLATCTVCPASFFF